MLVKGESNITSASISEGGDFLVVSTAAEIKAFQLRLESSDDKVDLRITKVDAPAAPFGASKVQISPDGSWVSWVQEGSKVMIAKVVASGTGSYTISHPAKLGRLRRDISKYVLLGGLGAYNRNVSHITFSPDSKMLAVADLAGYIDTWVLRGPGDLPNTSADDERDASSDESSDEEDDKASVSAGKWIRNPKAALLPKLSSVPVCISFQNRNPGSASGAEASDIDDYTLLVITASMQILTFNPLHGGLSAWSKRNPQARIPEQFRATRDLVKGVLWQGSRVWMYGVSFLFMLDLSEDLTPEKSTAVAKAGVKRKRNGTDSGAGGKMEPKHALAPQTVRVVVDSEKNEWMDVDTADGDEQRSQRATSSALEDDDDDDDEDTDAGELLAMRGAQDVNGKDTIKRNQKTKYWHTYKYRPILGIVPLSVQAPAEEGVSEDGFSPLEVALIERPIWDLDLPPRYFADGEWER
jgi:U3 small nucleolar RNA-associated protein 4